ncbi:MAG: hypothetical protein SF182_27390 [Deltaproteobacteria bacterium]|nr:hypothetical protein [Deltaproteobacteria bacterium]
MRPVGCLARLLRLGLVVLALTAPLAVRPAHAGVDTDVDEDDGLDVPQPKKIGDPDEIQYPDAKPRSHDEIQYPDAQPRAHDEIPFPDAQPPDPDAP